LFITTPLIVSIISELNPHPNPPPSLILEKGEG